MSRLIKRFFEWLYSKIDIGGGSKVDRILQKEYGYLLRIALLYPYLRNGLWIISAIQAGAYGLLGLILGYFLFMTVLYGKEDLNIAAQTIHYILLALNALSFAFFCIINRNSINKAHLIMNDKYFQYKEKFEIEELDEWKKISKHRKGAVFIYIPGYCFVVAGVAVFGPLIEGYYGIKRKDIEGLDMRLPIPIWHPFSREDPVVAYILLGSLMIGAALVALIISIATLMLINNYADIMLQYKIMHKSIQLLPQRAGIVYKKRFPKRKWRYRGDIFFTNFQVTKPKLKACYIFCLKESIQHQLILEDVVKLFTSAAVFPSGFGIISASIVLAISSLAVVLGDPTPTAMALSFLFVFGELAAVAIICYIGQNITDLGDELQSVIYGLNWMHYPKELTVYIKLMLIKSQRPLVILAGDILPMNNAAMVTVLQSAYSYFNLLLAMHGKKHEIDNPKFF